MIADAGGGLKGSSQAGGGLKRSSHSVIQGGGMDLGGPTMIRQSGDELKGVSPVCIARAMLLLYVWLFHV